MPTSEDFRRAAEAARIAEEDAYVIPRLTQHQRDLIRLYCALPDPLPEGPMETWNITVDPNAPLTRWREVLLPHKKHLDDPDVPCDLDADLDDDDPDDDDPDDDPDPTPPSGTGGKGGYPSGKPSGNKSGNKIGNPTAPQSAPTSPDPNPRRRVSRLSAAKPSGAVSTADSPPPGHPSGKHSGNASGSKIGKHSGNAITAHTPPPSPHGPFPPREGGRGLGNSGNEKRNDPQ